MDCLSQETFATLFVLYDGGDESYSSEGCRDSTVKSSLNIVGNGLIQVLAKSQMMKSLKQEGTSNNPGEAKACGSSGLSFI